MAGSGNRQPALKTYLGIDCGTSAVRVCAINDEDQIQALTQHGLNTQSIKSWQNAVTRCLHELFKQIPANSVQSVTVDGTSGTVLLCDESGEPLAGPRMYSEACHDVELDKLGAPEPVPALSVTAGLPKAISLAKGVARKKAIILHQADWISGWLSNRFELCDENNALKTGYDPERRVWPDWVRSALPAHVELPHVVIPGSPVGTASNILLDMGMSQHAIIRAGTTDSTASFLATGANQSDTGVSTLGSTLVIKQLSNTQITDLHRGIYSHRLGNKWLTGGASNSGGAVLKHYFSIDKIKELSRQINADENTGLSYYPLIQPGERFPINNPHQQPILSPRPNEATVFLQAMLEGIAEIEKTGYQTLNSLGCDRINRVLTAGGGAVNPVWTLIRERLLGCPVSTAKHTEAAYGSALLAKYGESLFDDFN
jgi:xylulokinase